MHQPSNAMFEGFLPIEMIQAAASQ